MRDDVARPRAERGPHANFTRPLGDAVRQHPNNPTPAIASAQTREGASSIAYVRGRARLVDTRSSIVMTESSREAAIQLADGRPERRHNR